MFISANKFIMYAPSVLALLKLLSSLSPGFLHKALLAAACQPAAFHPLWANNGRRGPSLKAYSLGLRGGVGVGGAWGGGMCLSVKG